MLRIVASFDFFVATLVTCPAESNAQVE